MQQERRTYTDEEKNEAVRRVLAGETPSAVASALGVPAETVRSWLHRSKNAVAVVATQSKKELFGELILEYCDAGLRTLKDQAELLGDRTFLRSEGGQIFAVAQSHRLLGDQLARYLAAINFGDD